MLRAERKYGPPLTKTLSSSCQKGSVLIVLIITMIVMTTLGAGMVYLTTTSTFQELFANYNARAYYAAESGGRYVNALIRQTLAMPGGSLSAIESSLNGIPFRMANDDQFQMTRWWDNDAPIGGSWIFEYDIVGTAGSGFLKAKRQITYRIHPADQGGIAVPPALPPEASEFAVPQGEQAAKWLSKFYSPTEPQDTKIFVQSAGGDAALNLAAASYTMGLKWYGNIQMAQLDTIRSSNGDLLSYGVQVKIWENENVDYSQMIGISFRLDDYATPLPGGERLDNMYGISFVKMLTKPATKPNSPDWYKNYIYDMTAWWDVFSTNPNKWFVVLWKSVYHSSDPDGAGPLGAGWNYMPLAYQKILQSNPVCLAGDINGCTKFKPWTTLMVYVEEISGGNKINGYLASPDTYSRRTMTPYNLDSQPLLWAEIGGDTDTSTVPSIFQKISWTEVSTADVKYIIEDGSLTTLNYNNYTPGIGEGDLFEMKAREIGLHIFTTNEGANKIFYDNFYVDLTPSGYGYAPGSGELITGP